MLKYIAFSLLFVISSIESAELHAIVVCDTHAIDLEESVEKDYKHIKKELKKIAKLTGLKLSMQTYTGHNVSSDFMRSVKKLKAKPDDVIVFYWSGHGTRFEDQDKGDPWPYFDFEYGDYLESLLDVTNELKGKKARLVLSIADCCNDFEGKNQFLEDADSRALNLESKGISHAEMEGYRKLFLEAKGVYIATAALPGESALGLDEWDDDMEVPGGGFFTNALLETLHTETKKPSSISWNTIFQITVAKSIEYQLRDLDDPEVAHHPHFECLSN